MDSAHPRARYAAARQARIDHRDQRNIEWKQELLIRRRGYWIHGFIDFWLQPVLLILLTVFLISLTVELEFAGRVSYVTLWPLLVMGCVLFLLQSIIVHCCCRCSSYHSICICSAPLGRPKVLRLPLDNYNYKNIATITGAIIVCHLFNVNQLNIPCVRIAVHCRRLLCLLWLVLTSMHVVGDIAWSWWLVFTPLSSAS
jgi:hypothetical protein